jgi:hypothetical protein
MENFRNALSIREEIARRAPGDAISHRDLARSHYNIGEIHMMRRMAPDSWRAMRWR